MGIDEHVRLLGGLLVLAGVVCLVLAVTGMVALGSPVGLIVSAAQAGTVESLQLPLMQVYGAILMIVGFIVAAPAVVVGLALRRFRPWSREAAMVVCTLLLAAFPIGTALGVYGFWVVLSPEVEPLFSERRF